MKYVNFNIGDWSSATRWLNATERGVLIDLLTTYYENERPLMQTECNCIASGYSDEEKVAQTKVLHLYFQEEQGTYVQKRCQKELEAYWKKSAVRAKAAAIRWEKEKKKNNANALQMQTNSNPTESAIDQKIMGK